MDLYFYSGRLDLAATSLADLRLLVPALDDELDPTNAATIARITTKLPSLVQSDVAEPLRLYCYDDAGNTLSSWITDAAVTVTVGLGAPNAETTGDYSTANAAISGSSRLASLVLNTQALANAMEGRRAAYFYLQIRQAPANGGETVLRLPISVLPGVISSPTNEDNAADISAAAASAVAAAASAAAAASSAGAASASEIAADADAVATAADRIQTGLDRAATTASAAAAAISEAAADEDADQTASDRTQTGLDVLSAAASALAAASSAAAAALTAAGAYKGGVAGGSVPATSTLAGDYYRITAVGTSQSKTWAVGDMAIYNGTSGSWTQLAGILPYATAAQARAGTDTTSALNSSTGNERALLGDMSRRIADSLYSDGATSLRRAEWTPGTAGAVAAMPISIPFEFQVPTSNPSASVIIAKFGPTTSPVSAGQDNTLNLFIDTSGGLSLWEIAVGSGNRRALDYSGFRAAYSGLWVRGMVVIASPDTTTAPVIYLQGVDATSSFSSGAPGTPPNWMPTALDTTRFYYGGAFTAGRFVPHGPILGALTAAEVLEWTQTGRLPTWCEIGTGDMRGLVTGDNSTFASDTGYWSKLAGATISGGKANFATAGTDYIQKSIINQPGLKYLIRVVVTDYASGTGIARLSSGEGISNITANGTYTAVVSPVAVYALQIGFFVGSVDSVEFIPLGPIFKPVIQPIPVLADLGTNKLAGILTLGITPVTEKRDWEIQATTNTSGNQQLLAASVFSDATKAVLDDWCMNTAGTPTVTAGSASAGTQYKSSGALTATRNMITLVTRVLASVNLWCGSGDTSSIQHTVRGHMVD